MTPQEQRLVDELFDRLANLETAPRDPDAERLIAAGMTRAPHAVYALVQTALVQDAALKRTNAHIEELEAQLAGGGAAAPHPQGGFLDTMRDAMFGRTQSAPRPAPGEMPQAPHPAGPYATGPYATGPYSTGPYAAGPGAPSFGGGGSFLGTAASAAAGVIGGGLLLDGIRSAFGRHDSFGGLGQTARERFADQPSFWGGGNDLARDAGIDDVGRAAAADSTAQPVLDRDQPDTLADDDSGDFNADYSDDGSYDV